MVTLINSQTGSDHPRRCDANCYNAKHDKCTCVCGGTNHGAGLQKATDNTSIIAENLARKYGREDIGDQIQKFREDGRTIQVGDPKLDPKPRRRRNRNQLSFIPTGQPGAAWPL